MWCDSLDAEQYVEFLSDTLSAITRTDSNTGEIRWASDKQVRSLHRLLSPSLAFSHLLSPSPAFSRCASDKQCLEGYLRNRTKGSKNIETIDEDKASQRAHASNRARLEAQSSARPPCSCTRARLVTPCSCLHAGLVWLHMLLLALCFFSQL